MAPESERLARSGPSAFSRRTWFHDALLAAGFPIRGEQRAVVYNHDQDLVPRSFSRQGQPSFRQTDVPLLPRALGVPVGHRGTGGPRTPAGTAN